MSGALESVWAGTPPNDSYALQERLPPGPSGAARRTPSWSRGDDIGMVVAPPQRPEGSGRIWGTLRESRVGVAGDALTMLGKSYMQSYPSVSTSVAPRPSDPRNSNLDSIQLPLVVGIPMPDSRKRGFRMTRFLGARGVFGPEPAGEPTISGRC
jgi:hypothetical protein